MNQKEQRELRERVEKIVGPTESWEFNKDSFEFRTNNWQEIPLKVLNDLSVELGTERINFTFGYSGEGGYSEYTPSVPGGPGRIQVLLPIK